MSRPLGRSWRPCASGFAALLACGAVLAGGCSGVRTTSFFSSNTLRITSIEQPTELKPNYRTSIYLLRDDSTADLYLSTLAKDELLAELKAARSFNDLPPALIAHIYLFLVPKAGRTPIEFTASNMTYVQIITAGGAAGYYGGGGFLLPSNDLGADTFSGRAEGVTVRPLGMTEGFEDLIGAGEATGGVSVRRDDELSRAIGSRLRALIMQDFPASARRR